MHLGVYFMYVHLADDVKLCNYVVSPITKLSLHSVYCSERGERGNSAPEYRLGVEESNSKWFTFESILRVGSPCVT